MNLRDWTRIALVGVIVLLIAVASGGMGFAAGWYLRPQALPSPTPSPASAQDDIQQRFRIFWEAWDIVQREFDHDGPLDTQKMIYGAVSGMVRALGDPHTLFLEPVQTKFLDQDLEGSFEGIGATVDVIEGNLTIVEPLPGSPALQAGLRPGDVVIEVDGKPLQDLDLTEAISLIRGPKDTQVQLLIRRQGTPEPFLATVTRRKIDMPTVTARQLDNNIAYVRLTDFNSLATSKLQAALRPAMGKKPRGLILDLRGNPGGYLHVAVEIASQFIREGTIVTDKDRDGKVTEYKAEGQGLALDVPLAILVDGGSASASEIVAGAVQDLGRGVLIGRKTFGKGSVQVSHALSDGSSLKVTVARWYTPKGHQIDGQGLTPEIVVPLDPNQPVTADPVLDRAVQYLSGLPSSAQASQN